MVYGAIARGISLGWRYRKQIYAVITAQDRAIKGAFVGTRVSKAGQWGWRTGAGAGSLIGSLITEDDGINDDDGLQKEYVKVPSPGKYSKTRGGSTRSTYRGREVGRYHSKRCPKSCACKRQRR